ncbi:hypothetical protein [Phenylobacterium sp.]|uniref:hypothetical protein n=1 Tax=Phenylobacterium sp. TaxID=1871053 RepID=UPI002811FD49|nr:hypothetical protein [Phenylobacterium sp.]
MRKIATLAASAAFIAVAALTAAPAEAQSRQRSYQAYAVIDFQTEAPKGQVIDAAERILEGYASDFQSNRPIAVQTPEQPGRFQLTNPLAESRLAGLAALGGVSTQQYMVATCDGAVWTANVNRSVSGSQQLRVQLCLFPYKNAEREGYHLNLFASDTAMSGGGLSERFGRALANRLVGTPRDFTENMLRQTVQAIEATTGAAAVLVEGEPEIPGLAWRR